MSKVKLVHRTVVMVLALVLTISATIAYARYREELEADQGFAARPLELVKLDAGQWQYVDGKFTMEFTVEKTVEACRVYVAVSQGMSAPDEVKIELTTPTQEILDYTVLYEEIYRGTTLYGIFGPGHVYRFTNGTTDQELNFSLIAGEQYTISVEGLDAATQEDCLLRVFVEGIK